ncbi:septum formation initiator family protein [Actinoplanes sp. NPDC051633]|jgi:cell division protein FtsB|uniref:FtsB family cell division protein n=1 Tax=Actinoplanes sp. NPDC051633 TaxID=3155670 RepID=UPI003415289D
MTQRRMPSGQGPARRPGRASRPTQRVRVRDTASTRVEPRATAKAARPVAARRTAATKSAVKRTVAPRPKAFTGRAAVLVGLLVALVLAYTYPVRTYLAQESQIAKMKAAQDAQRAVIAEKAQEVAKWQDPVYVGDQARARLFYVRPGEIPLIVLNDPEGAARDAGKTPAAAPPDKWYDTLWSSVEAANTEPK